MKRLLPLLLSVVLTGVCHLAQAQISLNLGSGNPVLCSGQSLSLGSYGGGGQSTTATGGIPPYTFQWSGPNGFTSTLSNPVISPVSALNTGNYFVTVTDQSVPPGLIIGSIGVLVNAVPPVPLITGTPSNLSHCNIVTLTTTPGPYFYSWASTLQNPIPGANGSAYQATQSGTYFLMAMDPLTLCQSVSNPLTVSILGPKPALNDISGSNFVNCSGTDFWLTVENISTGPPGNYFKIIWGDGTFNEYQPGFPASPPSHHYLTTGVFTLQFIVTNAFGCTDTVTYTVYNVTAPAISLPYSGNQSQCDTLTVNFLIQGYENNHPSTTYTMYFGDGSYQVVTPTLPPPYHVSHLYTKNSCEEISKSFTARIVASNACDSAIATITPIKVYKRPGTEFQLPQQNRCVGQSLTFQNTSTQAANPTNCNGITDYTWSWGDGTPNQQNMNSNGTPNGIHTYANAGTYQVCLTAHGLCGDSVYCDSICITRPVNPGFTMDTNAVCAPDTVYFTDTTDLNGTCGEETYQWVITYSNPGNCTSSVTPQYLFVNGTTVSSRNPAIRFNRPGIYSIRLSVTNSCNTYTSPAKIVTVMGLPAATISATGLPNPACTSISLNPGVSTIPNTSYRDCYGSILTYTWTADCGSFPNPDQPYPGTLICNVPGNHSITVMVENACGNHTATLPFVLYPEPVADPVPDKVVCPGEVVSFGAFTGSPANVSFTWTRTPGTIGLTPTSGTANIPVFTAVNTSNSPLVITFTVTPHANGCNGTPKTFTLTINPDPEVTSPTGSIQFCHGDQTNLIPIVLNVPGAVFSWVNSQTAIGLQASGSGSIPSFTAQNITAANLTGVITISPEFTNAGKTCPGVNSTYTLGVNPVAVADQPEDTLVCAGILLNFENFTGSPAGLSYTWSNSNTTIGLAASGNGNLPNFTPPGSLTSPVTSTITLTPQFTVGAKTCPGTPVQFHIDINPKPSVTATSGQIWCHEDSVPAIIFTGPVSGTVFNWINSNPSIGIVGPGQDTIPYFTAQNTGSTSINGQISVTPVFTNNGLSCTGSLSSYIITIKPSPVIQPVTDTTYCEGDPTRNILFQTNIPSGVSYSWTNTNSDIGVPLSGNSNILSFIAQNNTTAPITGCFSVIATAAGCTGPGLPFCITVNPSPHPVITGPAIVPSGTTATLSVPAPLYSLYTWASTPAGQMINPVNTQSVTTVPLLTPSVFFVTVTNAWGCDSSAQKSIALSSPVFQIMSISADPPEICSGEPVHLEVVASGGSGTYSYAWSSSPISPQTIASISNPLVYPETTGSQLAITYTVTVSDGINPPLSNSVTVLVNPNPTLSVPPVSPVCDSSAVQFISNPASGTPPYSFSWTGPSGSAYSSGFQNPVIPNATTGGFFHGMYHLEITDSKQCSAKDSVFLQILSKPLLSATSNSPICDSSLLELHSQVSNGNAPFTWLWTGPSGSNFNSGSADTAILSASLAGFHAGQYRLIVSDLNGCRDTAFREVVIYRKPQAQALSNAPICDSSRLELYGAGFDGVPPYQFSWSGPPASGFTAVQASPNIALASLSAVNQGSYTLTIEDQNHCTDTARINVIIHGKPVVSAISNSPVCDLTKLVLSGNVVYGTPPYSWLWTGPSGSGFNSVSPLDSILQASLNGNHQGNYTLMVNDTHQCKDTISIPVTLFPLPDVAAVNSFTICNGTDTPPIDFNGSISGTQFNWNVSSPVFIGLNSSGNGAIPSFAAMNPTHNPVTATITVTPVANGCSGQSRQFSITVNPTPDVVISPALPQTYCASSPTQAVSFSSSVSGTTMNWSYTGPDIGISSSGIGTIPSFLTQNQTTAPISTTFTINPVFTYAGVSCPGPAGTTVITIAPLPLVNPLGDQEVCSGTAMTLVSLSSPVPGTTFSWNHTNALTGMPYPGSFGNFILPYVLNNPGQQIIYDTVSVFPSLVLNNLTCIGPDTGFIIMLHPKPVVNPVSGQTLCAGSIASHVIFTSYNPATTISWANSIPSIGLPAAGSGNIPPFIALNSGLYDELAIITAYPYAEGCQGDGIQFGITVKPVPAVDSIPDQVVCNNQPVAPIVFTGPVWNTSVYHWNNLFNTGIGMAQNSGTSQIPGFTAINTLNNPVTATFRVTPEANGCQGTFREFTITVNPSPQIDNLFDQNVCSGTAMMPENFDNSVNGTTYFWTNNHPEIGLPASGNGNIPAYVLTNNTLNTVFASITVITSAQSCAGDTGTFLIQVMPEPRVQPVSDIKLCHSDSLEIQWNALLTGTIISWTNSNIVTGFPSSGTGDIPAFVTQNATLLPDTSVVQYWPVLQNGALVCVGDTTGFSLVVYPLPEFTISSNAPVCDSSLLILNSQLQYGVPPLTYQWSGPVGSGFSSSYPDPQLSNASISGGFNGNYSLTVTDSYGCAQSDSVAIILHSSPLVSIVPAPAVCEGSGIQLIAQAQSGTPVYQWLWECPGLPIYSSSLQNPWLSPDTALLLNLEEIRLSVTDSHNCSGTASTLIQVYPKPVAVAISNSPVCPGSNLIVTGSASNGSIPLQWFWNGPAASGFSSTAQTDTLLPTVPLAAVEGSYRLIVEDDHQCRDTAFTLVNLHPLPALSALQDQEVCSGSAMLPVLFSGTIPGMNYQWNHQLNAIGMPFPGGYGNSIPAYVLNNPGQQTLTDTVRVIPSVLINGEVCTGPAEEFTLTVFPEIILDPVENQAVCAGSLTTGIVFNSPEPDLVVSWTNSNPSIGLPASGTGPILPFTAINNTLFDNTAVITLFPSAGGCEGPSRQFSITVKPLPQVDPVANLITCHGSQIPSLLFTGPVWNTTDYLWNNVYSIPVGLASMTGNDSIPLFTAINTGNTPITATFTVIPISGTCSGALQTFTITVKPEPKVDNFFDQQVCPGTLSLPEYFDNNVGNQTVFTWNHTQPEIGIPASGTGNLPAFQVINNSLTSITSLFTVIPSAEGCTGIADTFFISVYPKPLADNIASIVSCPGQVLSLPFTSPQSAAWISWTNTNIGIGLAASGTGTAGPFTTLNPGNIPLQATLNFIPHIQNGTMVCHGDTGQITITVNPAPQVQISSPGSLCDSTSLTLTGTISYGTPPYNYQWSGPPGSGFSSVSVAPLIAPVSIAGGYSGTYEVSITDQSNCTASASLPVLIYPKPAVTAQNSSPACDGSSVTLSASVISGSPGYSWNWTGPAGSGFTGTVQQATINAASFAGNHNGFYRVIVQDQHQCKDTAWTTVNLVHPAEVFAGTDTMICEHLSLILQQAVATNYSSLNWSSSGTGVFSNFSQLQSGYDPSSADVLSGSVNVILTAQGISPCPAVKDSLVLGFYQQTAAFAGPADTICEGEPYPLVHSAVINADTYLWTTSGNGSFDDPSLLNPVYTPGTADIGAGEVSLCLHSVNSVYNCGDSTSCMRLTIKPLPEANAGPDRKICLGDTIFLQADGGDTYLWTPPEGLSNIHIPNPQTSPVISTTYFVDVWLNQCHSRDSLRITVNPLPVAVAGPDQEICVGDSALLTAGGGISWLWNTLEVTSSIIVNPLISSSYWVSVTDANQCSDTDTLTITVNPLPLISINPENPVLCRDSVMELEALGAETYLWTPDFAILNSPTANPVQIMPQNNLLYQVTGTDLHGCRNSRSVYVKVIPSPELHLSDPIYLCPGDLIELNAGQEDSTEYFWSGNTTGSPLITISNPGIYWVEARNPGCRVSDTIHIEDGTVVWFPNAFTPFDDNGINDEFLAKSNTPLLSYHLYIFNRWGGLVFETQDITHGWDGTFEGKRCMGGIFVYKVIYTTAHLCDDNKTTNDYHTGTIMLLE